MKKYLSSLAASLSLLIAATGGSLLMGGCGTANRTVSIPGGAGSGTTVSAETGSATFQINWPARTSSKLIPVASNSILVQITFQGRIVAAAVATRPTGTLPQSILTFGSLPVGNLGVTVYAVPDTLDPANPPLVKPTDAQASGTGTLNVQASKAATLTINLRSTIASLVITPVPTTGTDFITIGQTQTLSVEALDTNGAMVLITPQTVQWSVAFGAILKLRPHTAADADPTGIDITGVLSGDTRLTVYETESTRLVTLPVSVRGALAGVRITTILPSVDEGGYVEFGYVGTDASGYTIPGAAIPTPTWTIDPADLQTATIDRITPEGYAIVRATSNIGTGPSPFAHITLTAGSFTDLDVLTVTAIQGSLFEQLSPTSVFLDPSTSQTFLSWTYDPTNGLNVPTNVSYQIVIPTGGNPTQFGTLVQYPGKGYCVYTTPAVRPTITTNGVTTTVTQIQIQASNGAAAATVTLR